MPVPDKAAMQITTAPTGFAMNATLALRADNSAAWVPSHIKKLHVDIKLLKNNDIVGGGDLSGGSVAARRLSTVNVPISFSHKSVNTTGDDTQLAFTSACAHLCMFWRVAPLTFRSRRDAPMYVALCVSGLLTAALDLAVSGSYEIRGAIGSTDIAFQLMGLPCPFEMPN